MPEGVNPATNHRIMISGASSYNTQTMDIHVYMGRWLNLVMLSVVFSKDKGLV